jgi:TrpR family trp operon transcriptional repressor
MMDLEGALLMVKSRSEMEAFLLAVLSPSELRKFRRRWEVFQRELAGETQRAVSTDLGLGVATASRVAAAIRQHGEIIRTVLGRAEEHQSRHGVEGPSSGTSEA